MSRHIVPYRGYGDARHVRIEGRLLEGRPLRASREKDRVWHNLKATWQRWFTDEIGGALVRLRMGGREVTTVTDHEGYYEVEFDPRGAPVGPVTVRHDWDGGETEAVHEIVEVDPGAPFMVVSDVDDTVIVTGLTDRLRAARLTFLRNAHTRRPLPGVAELYRALVAGADATHANPIFYLSNSAWNMYDLLDEFIRLHDIPVGPLLLRDVGRTAQSSRHKQETLHRLLATWPDMPAVLVGDSGQHDAEVYARIVRELPDRILAVYIRDVHPGSNTPWAVNTDREIEAIRSLGVPFERSSDSLAMARHARSIGLLGSDAQVEAVEAAVAKDEETNARRRR